MPGATSRPAEASTQSLPQSREFTLPRHQIERRITCSTSGIPIAINAWSCYAPACIGSINPPAPRAAQWRPSRRRRPRAIPPANCPDSANARSFVEVMTVILPASGPMRLIADENTSHVDMRRGEHHGTDPARNGVTIARVELTQAFERQHGSPMLCAMKWTWLCARGRHDGSEQVFEVVAGEHRAVAVSMHSRTVPPWKARRRPSVAAAELNCIGEAAGHNSFGLQQMSDDHTEPLGTLPATGPLLQAS